MLKLVWGARACMLSAVIGTNGNNIKKAKAIPGVRHVDVRNDDTIIIFADQPEQAEAARELLEIVTEQVGQRMRKTRRLFLSEIGCGLLTREWMFGQFADQRVDSCSNCRLEIGSWDR